jgi:hypothetical protein
VVECLPSKPEALSSNPNITKRKKERKKAARTDHGKISKCSAEESQKNGNASPNMSQNDGHMHHKCLRLFSKGHH